MAGRQEQHRADPTVDSIERLLKAERDGIERLEQSRDTARQTLAEARGKAADLARRTDARISKLYTAYLARIDAEIERIRNPDATAPDTTGDRADGPAHDLKSIERAARRIAAKLTGDA